MNKKPIRVYVAKDRSTKYIIGISTSAERILTAAIDSLKADYGTANNPNKVRILTPIPLHRRSTLANGDFSPNDKEDATTIATHYRLKTELRNGDWVTLYAVGPAEALAVVVIFPYNTI